VVVHALIGFSWIFIFVVQTTLVNANQIKWHMTLGWAGVIMAVLLCVSIFTAVLNRAARDLDAGLTREQLAEMDGLNPATIVIFDMGGIFFFACLFFYGIRNRKKPERHRMIMVYAGIAAVFQAFVRIGIIFFGAELGLPAGAIIALIVILLPIIYELIKLGRPKKLTVGLFLFLIIAQIIFQIIGHSPIAIDLAWDLVELWHHG
jgi:hypothetical protein